MGGPVFTPGNDFRLIENDGQCFSIIVMVSYPANDNLNVIERVHVIKLSTKVILIKHANPQQKMQINLKG